MAPHLSLRKRGDDSIDNNDIEFEAESIIGCRLIQHSRTRQSKQTMAQQLDVSVDPNDFEFLIKWKGYPLHDATWEPYSNLKNSPILLNEYITAKCLPDHWRLTNFGRSRQRSRQRSTYKTRRSRQWNLKISCDALDKEHTYSLRTMNSFYPRWMLRTST